MKEKPLLFVPYPADVEIMEFKSWVRAQSFAKHSQLWVQVIDVVPHEKSHLVLYRKNDINPHRTICFSDEREMDKWFHEHMSVSMHKRYNLRGRIYISYLKESL